MTLIDKYKLIQEFVRMPCSGCIGKFEEGGRQCFECLYEKVCEAESIEAVPVVRCRACKWLERQVENDIDGPEIRYYCHKPEESRQYIERLDYFCFDGVKRGEDE